MIDTRADPAQTGRAYQTVPVIFAGSLDGRILPVPGSDRLQVAGSTTHA